ncbi:hypothetical protein FRC00_005608, partial [Tulasnella sp. 408]
APTQTTPLYGKITLYTYHSFPSHLSSKPTSHASHPSPLRPGTHRIVPHVYIRYFGDFSGGQVIKCVVAKTYNLEDGQGTSFLDFAGLTGPAGKHHATSEEVNKLKEWFKEGMDTGVTDGAEKKAVVEEAILAFKYNQGLFGLLKAPEGETSRIAMIKFLGVIWLEQVIGACKESFARRVTSGRSEFTVNPSVIPLSVVAFGVSYLALRILKIV